MAIKGKKKSQSRGSQARRRPAAAPRTIGAGARRPPWYKTPQGRTALVALLLVVAAIVTGVVLKARSNSANLADRQDALENYTGSVRAVLQTLTPAASEMTTTPLDAGDFAGLSRLPRRAEGWEETINAALDQVTVLEPPPRALLVQSFLEQSGQLYLSTARIFEIMPDQPNKVRGELLAEATALRDQANILFVNATSLLDDIRAELDMDPSGLAAPASAPANAPPSPIQTAPPPQGGGGGGNGGNGGNGGGNNQKGSG